jgi:hypothetical protein
MGDLNRQDNQDEADLEIGDVEGFTSTKDIMFSHSALVMSAMRRVLEAGSQEMTAGYFNKKFDKHGNVSETYIPDGRKTYIACVERVVEVMYCDFDEEAEENVSALIDDFEIKKKKLIIEEESTWKGLDRQSVSQLISNKIIPIKGYIVLPLIKELLTEFQLEIHKKIFTELNNLTKRLDFYRQEQIEG